MCFFVQKSIGLPECRGYVSIPRYFANVWLLIFRSFVNSVSFEEYLSHQSAIFSYFSSMSDQPLYCEVILPLALKGTFTYRLPEGWEEWVIPGVRVEVQFGKRKIYTALVRSVHNRAPVAYAAKDLLAVTDEAPIVNEILLKFWDWMAAYYCCYLGEVMQAALPAYFKLDSETHYLKNPDFTGDILELPDDEYMVASALEHQEKLTLEDIQIILQRKGVSKVVKSLLDKGVLFLEEYLEERYRPRKEMYIRLHPQYVGRTGLHEAFNLLQRSPKQSDLLLSYLDICPKHDWIQRSVLLSYSGTAGHTVKALADKGIFELEEREVYRVREEVLDAVAPPLSDVQEEVRKSINEQWQQFPVVMMKGVTASGKTHVYAELIKEVIQSGRQVLYLLPEIALTTQLIKRLEQLIGKVGVYHSRFNPSERVETWYKVLREEYSMVVGARSALFLPFQKLGLIIVDEEHDGSYKQQEPAPRYHARDSAIFLAHLTGAKVLLGSATPSMETWVNVKTGKFGYAVLGKRHGDMLMPDIQFVNMSLARKEHKVTGMFSEELQNEIVKTLKAGRQVIVFQNRRGYSPNITCRDCGWVSYCKNCDVSMTYHKYADQLKCHYCGYAQQTPPICPACGSTVLEQKGAGTERIEDDMEVLFPESRILRLDYDTAKSKYSHEKIIEQFANKEADILIGTQMVTKGLDFSGVGLVTVLNADALLHYPDFRAMERAYQLLQQVSGRAGRSGDKGKVLIQINNPKHSITGFLLNPNMEVFYDAEWAERKMYHYPPHNRLIHLSIRDREPGVVEEAARYIYEQLKPRIEGECLGPAVPGISRVKGLYIREILLKLPRNPTVLKQAKAALEEIRQLIYQYKKYRNVRFIIDVDP